MEGGRGKGREGNGGEGRPVFSVQFVGNPTRQLFERTLNICTSCRMIVNSDEIGDDDNQLVEVDCQSPGGSTVGETLDSWYQILCKNSSQSTVGQRID